MKATHKPVRNPEEAVLSTSIPRRLKMSVMGRAKLLDRPMSQIVRYALEAQEDTRWKDIPHGVLTPTLEAKLKRWLDSKASIEEL